MSPLGFPLQQAGAAIQIGDWPRDEDFPVFPGGSKPKRMITCPHREVAPFLIPGHSYLFKTATGWQQQQVWSEVIAYRIAALIGLNVPPCFLAVDQYDGTTGALVEFFYGYPKDPTPARLIHGSDLLSLTFADKKRGRPHFVRRNLLTARFLKVEGADEWWGRALTFDALIGNTDRHPENWGLLVSRDSRGKVSYQMAPPFDNATSLGYEIDDRRAIEVASDEKRLWAYIARGAHHCEWDPIEPGLSDHTALCARFIAAYPEAGAAMRNVIRFELDQVRAVLDDCTRYDVGIKFTVERAALVLNLIERRRELLSRALGG